MSEKIATRRWGPDCERVRVAEAITGPLRHGKIDGVLVDFRHAAIDADEWEPRPWWHYASDSAGSARLMFPTDEAMRVPPVGSGLRVGAGDSVRLGEVERRKVGPEFLHDHDTTALVAEIVVERKGGAVEVGGPLMLFGVTALRSTPAHEAFDRMAARLRGMLNLVRLNDYPLPHFAAKQNGLVEEAAYFLRSAESRFASMTDSLAHLDAAPDRNEPYHFWGAGWWQEDMAALLNHAVLSGYLLARSETEAAESAVVARDRILAGGRLALKDYDGRRVRAQEIWERHPKWTINRVASEVARELGKDKASVMASLWSEVPATSPSYGKALEKVRAGEA